LADASFTWSVSTPALRPFIGTVLNSLDVLTPRTQQRRPPQSKSSKALGGGGDGGVKGRRSGARVGRPGCGRSPVWGSGRSFWSGASWLLRRWPAARLWRRRQRRGRDHPVHLSHKHTQRRHGGGLERIVSMHQISRVRMALH